MQPGAGPGSEFFDTVISSRLHFRIFAEVVFFAGNGEEKGRADQENACP